ncbi:MAG: hypothetical protein KIT73_03885 [Burkholderiales bacterium]|nr:hypothetical protein [Burkholderiales bacterium]
MVKHRADTKPAAGAATRAAPKDTNIPVRKRKPAAAPARHSKATAEPGSTAHEADEYRDSASSKDALNEHASQPDAAKGSPSEWAEREKTALNVEQPAPEPVRRHRPASGKNAP